MLNDFHCSKTTLRCLNTGYIMVAFLLIGVATYTKTSSMITSLPIIGGIVACGVFLLLVAFLGLIAAERHHQVLLFFYMVILFGIFIIQFSVACACLSFSKEQQVQLAETAWSKGLNSSDSIIFDAENAFSCCGFRNANISGYKCDKIPACMPQDQNKNYKCPTCLNKIKGKIGYAFSATGGLGLFFAFTEIFGSIVAARYRNMIEPISGMDF